MNIRISDPTLRRGALRLCAIVAAATSGACGGGGDAPTAPTLEASIPSATVEIGNNIQLSVRNARGTVTWSSSNTSVATVVSTGFVTAVGPGSATITAATATQSVSTLITVPALPAIRFSTSSIAFSGRVGSPNPAPQTVAITDSAGPGLQGLGISSIQYGAGQPAGWLTATLSSPTATLSQASTLQLSASVAALTPGVYTATAMIIANTASNTPRGVTVTFTVAAQPTIDLSATTAQFNAVAGGANPSSSAISVTSSTTPATGLTAAITYNQPAQTGWLTATLNTTTTPATLTVQAITGARPAGTYTATVVIASPDAANSPRNVAVTFVVASPPQIDATVTSFAFAGTVAGANPTAQVSQLTNGGGGTLSGLTATVLYTTGNGWLNATLNTATAPATLTVQPSLTGLAVGTYTATVRISAPGASNTPRDFPVTLTISTLPAIVAAPTTLSFTSGASQTVAVSNGGGGTLTGLVPSIQYVSGSGWLTATLNTATAPATLTVQTNVTGLAAGTYTANVLLTSAVASNSPLVIPVTLSIVAPPVIALSATSAPFSGAVGGAVPAPQTIVITNSGGGTLSGLSVPITYTGGTGWLSATLNTTTAPATLTLQANQGGLPAGTYTATVNVTSATATNSPRPITVSFTVLAPVIGVSATTSVISLASGNGNATGTVSVSNSGGGTLSGLSATVISSTAPGGTVTASINTTTAPATVTFNGNTGTAGAPTAPGTYSFTVRIASALATNSPVDVTVTFTVLVSLANNIYSQLYPTYCSGCHFAGGSVPALNTVTAFRNNLVGVATNGNTGTYPLAATYNRRIVAGSPSTSYLMYQLNKVGGANPMPTSGASVVPPSLIALMNTWILQGANNN